MLSITNIARRQMFIKIDFVSDIPIYQQIKDQVIEGIASGSITEGESLPSVRQFAEDLGVNMHTVNKAYSMLKNEGFVAVHKRQGVVVNSRENLRDRGFLKEIEKGIKILIAQAYCKGITEEEFLEKCRKIYSSFNKG